MRRSARNGSSLCGRIAPLILKRQEFAIAFAARGKATSGRQIGRRIGPGAAR